MNAEIWAIIFVSDDGKTKIEVDTFQGTEYQVVKYVMGLNVDAHLNGQPGMYKFRLGW